MTDSLNSESGTSGEAGSLSRSVQRWLRCRAAVATWLAILFVGLVTMCFFREALLTGKSFYIMDHAVYYVPVHVANAHQRAAGNIPLWNRHGFLGYPTQAENEESGVYAPGLLFSLVDNPGRAYTLYLLFHFLLAAYGSMYLTRVAGAGVLGQTAAALIFALGGSAIGHRVSTMFTTIAWTPMILGLQLQSFQTRSINFSVIAGILLAVQASGAHPQAGFYQILLMLAATLMEFRGAKRWSTGLFAAKSTLLIGGIGACLCAPQLWYCLEHLAQSSRAAWTGTFWVDITDSFPPHFLVQLVVPDLLRLEINEHRIYFGLISLALICLGWRARGRFMLQFRVVLIVGLILALGKFGILYELLLPLPIFSSTRSPVGFLLLVSLAAAVLAGLGLDELVCGCSDLLRFRRVVVSAYGILSALLLLTACLLQEHLSDPGLLSSYQSLVSDFDLQGYTPSWDTDAMRHWLQMAIRSMFTASLLAGVCAVCWSSFRRNSQRHLAGVCTLVLIAGDLLVCNSGIEELASPDFYTKVPPIIEKLREDPGLWRAHRAFPEQSDSYRADPASFPFDMASLFGFDALNADGAAVPARLEEYWGGKMTLKEQSLYNVKYLLNREQTSEQNPAWAEHQLLRDGDYCLYRNPYWQPRVQLRQRISVLPDASARSYINSNAFQLAASVVVGEPPVFFSGSPIKESELRDHAEVLHYSADRVVINAQVSRDSILVLSDLFYPGWRATSNGTEMKILRANNIVRGLALGAGRHRIEFAYRPAPFYRGLYICAAACFVLLGCAIRRAFACRQRRRSATVT